MSRAYKTEKSEIKLYSVSKKERKKETEIQYTQFLKIKKTNNKIVISAW